MRKTNGLPSGGYTFTRVPVEQGGAVTCMEGSDDGTIVICGDVYNAWKGIPLATGEYQYSPLFTAQSLPAGTFGPTMPDNTTLEFADQFGAYACTPAPSNSSVIYGIWNAMLFKSSNGGTSFTSIGGPYVTPGTAYGTTLRYINYKLAVHKTDPNTFMLGTMGDLIVYSTNGGTTVSTIAASISTFTGSISGTTLTVGTVTGTALAIGQYVFGSGVANNTRIISGSGTTWTVSKSQTVASTAMHVGNNYDTNRGGPAPHTVAFDPTSNKCCYSFFGVGIFESTTGPSGTFSLLSGSPPNAYTIKYDALGNLWALNAYESSSGNVYKKAAAGSFAKVTNSTNKEFTDLGVDLTTNGTLVGVDATNYMYKSTDSGANWTAWTIQQQRMFSTTCAWMGKLDGRDTVNNPNGIQIGGSRFLSLGGKYYCPNGFGVFSFTLPSGTNPAAVPWDFIENGKGFLELETPRMLCVPGGKKYMQTHDRGLFVLEDLTRATNLDYFGDNRARTNCWTFNGNRNSSGWSVEYVPGTTDHIVQCNSFFGIGAHGISKDGGKTWTPFGLKVESNITGSISGSTLTVTAFTGNPIQVGSPIFGTGVTSFSITGLGTGTGGVGTYTIDHSQTVSSTTMHSTAAGEGQIIPLSDTELYWFPSSSQLANWSTDGGLTWQLIPEFPNGTFGLINFANAMPACVDYTNNTLYVWNWDTNATYRGVWAKQSGGSWTRVLSGYVYSNVGSFSAHLKAVPGQTGHLFWKGDNNTPLMRSTNGGATWAAVPNTTNIDCFGFGKAAPGQTYPTIIFHGYYNSVYGMYVSYDNFATTPQTIVGGDYPGGNIDYVYWIEGDMDVFGQFFVTMQHNGAYRALYNCPKTLN